MNGTRLLIGCWTLAAWCCFPQLLAAGEREERVAEGEKLFQRDWSQYDPADGQAADGLGPMFNAVSCVACHSQAGTGGGGPNDQNVRLLSPVQVEIKSDAVLQEVDLHQREDFVGHPNLIENDSTILHRFGRNKGYAELVQPLWEQNRLTLLGWARNLDVLSELRNEIEGKVAATRKAMALLRTERNTPALFGAGLIDSIDREALVQLARSQNERYPEITGEVAPNNGKFGWRGQIATLREFVLGACANELGLQVKGFPQANDVLTHPGLALVKHDPKANDTLAADMTDDEITALVSYVEQLPPPSQQIPKSGSDRFLWSRGARHFVQAQCNACHVERIGMVKGIYSDLLLHDLGPELFDPVSLDTKAVGYFALIERVQNGSTLVSPPEQEWRTPPLWGVGNSAPYMHDGRAATIDDAIRMHGGEAAKSRSLYLRLREPAQRELIAYVKSLGAPAGDNILVTLARRRGEKIIVPQNANAVEVAGTEDPLKTLVEIQERFVSECGFSGASGPVPLPAVLVESLTKP